MTTGFIPLRLGLILVLLAGLPSVTYPADGSELDRWMISAIENNPELAAARSQWEAAQQRAPQARSFMDPMFGADVERHGTTKFSDYDDIEWMVSQQLPWPGQRGANIRASEQEAEAAGFQYLEKMRALRAEVISAAWKFWLAQRAIEVNQENAELVRRFEASARARYESGSGMQADILRAQVELSILTNGTVTLTREREVAQAAVNKLLNAPADTPRPIPEMPDSMRLDQSVQHYRQRARAHSAALIAAGRTVKAREAGARAARLADAPEFQVRVEARQFEGDHSIMEYDTALFVNIPWLWHGKYGGQIRQARAELAMAEGNRQDAVNMTQLEIQEWFTLADTAQRNVDLYRASILPQSRQLAEVTEAEYQTGGSSFFELIDAERGLQNAMLEFYRARADLGSALARLDQMAGPYRAPELATGLVTEADNARSVE